MGSVIIKTLFLDTATNLLVVGLLNETKSVIKTRLGKQDNSAYIIDTIDKLLTEQQVSIKDIDQLVVGVGPGSYTGIRISVMVAKTLSSTLSKPLKAISSIAFLTSGYEKKVFGYIDARNQLGFSGMYEKAKNIEKDELRAFDTLSQEQLDHIVYLDETTAKIELNHILKNSTIVPEIHNLLPNYLRQTEAERNHDQNSK